MPVTIITRTPLTAAAGLFVLLAAVAWVSPSCEGHAIGWGEEFPTPVLTSDGEVCEIVERHEDEDVIISGYHDDFADHALFWMLEVMKEHPEELSAQDLEMIEYLEDCLSEKPTPVPTPAGGQ